MKQRLNTWSWFMAATVLLAWALPAQAQVCVVAVAAPVFPGYSASAATGNGTVSVTCTVAGVLPQDISYTVELGWGLKPDGMQRRMASGGDHLLYNLYCDPSRSQVWANGSNGSCTVAGGRSGLVGVHVANHPVYGYIPGGQFVRGGLYTDSLPVLVLY